jgi:hypothetical protein
MKFKADKVKPSNATSIKIVVAWGLADIRSNPRALSQSHPRAFDDFVGSRISYPLLAD